MKDAARVDVGIVTVIGAELRAIQDVLGVSESERSHDQGDLFWSTRVKSRLLDRELQIVIHCIGQAGNAPAGAATTKLIERFNPRFLMLCGIGAGLRGKVRIGDVAVPRAVVDTSMRVAESNSVKLRPRIPALPHPTQQMLAAFRLDEAAWHQRCRQFASGGIEAPAERRQEYERHVTLSPTLHEVAFASDDLLLRNPDVLTRLTETVHQQIRIGEMEAGGFTSACEARHPPVPWLVVRGVSDFGDEFKDDAFHRIASYAAATFVEIFIANGFDPRLLSPSDASLDQKSEVRSSAAAADAVALAAQQFAAPAQDLFVGRTQLLAEIATVLEKGPTCVLGGIPGIGKTSLCAQLVKSHVGDRQFVWVDCNAFKSVELAVAELARLFRVRDRDDTLANELARAETDVARRIAALAVVLNRRRVVFVLDNYEDLNSGWHAVVELLNAHLTDGRLLICSRTALATETFARPIRHFNVVGLGEEESVELLKGLFALMGRRPPPLPAMLEAHRRLGGHPYMLRLLVALAEWTAFEEIVPSLPSEQEQASAYLRGQLFERLEGKARLLLENLATLRVPFRRAVGGFMEREIGAGANVFDRLQRSFLVFQEDEESQWYVLHQVVREYALASASAEVRRSASGIAAKYYLHLSDRAPLEERELCHHAMQAGMLEDARRAADKFITFAIGMGALDLALETADELLRDSRCQSWPLLRFQRAKTLRFKDRQQESLKEYEAALKCAKSDERLRQTTMFEVAAMLAKLSKGPQDSRHKKALRMYEELASAQDPDIALSSAMCVASMTAQEVGIKQALRELETLTARARKMGEPRLIAQGKYAMGLLKGHSNRLAGAAKDYEECIELVEQASYPDFEMYYFAHEHLANVYWLMGRREDALRVGAKCVAVDERLGIPRRLAARLQEQGVGHAELGQFAAAQQCLRRSVDIADACGGLSKVAAAALEWLPYTHWSLGQFERAVEAILEYGKYCSMAKRPAKPHLIMVAPQVEAPLPEEVRHLTWIIPPEIGEGAYERWRAAVLKRRPELANNDGVVFECEYDDGEPPARGKNKRR